MNNTFYIYLSSQDSRRYFPTNRASNFTVQLPEVINLEGNWEIGLVEVYFHLADDITRPHLELEIISNVCQDSIKGGEKLAILRNIFPTKRKAQFITFPYVFYLPLRQHELNQISIYIRDLGGEEAIFLKGSVGCTLEFRQTLSETFSI